MSRKERLRLGDVRPSGQNPRRDFGDVAALARSIEATGGQPVSPIVVARDGDGYRIVDGERRYRAMLELGAEECDALVCEGWGEAEEVVAMMATDEKKALTDEERARGFQGMLSLGVSDEVASGASGVDAEVVRRVRRTLAEVPEQATLDAMIEASAFDDPEDRARVLASRFPSQEAAEIRRRRREDERFAKVRHALDSGPLYVEWPEGERPSPWSGASMREAGVAYAFDARSAASARRGALEISDAHPGCELRAWRDGAGAVVYRVTEEGELSPREVAEGLRWSSAAALSALVASVSSWLAGLGEVPPRVAALVRAGRDERAAREALGAEGDGGDEDLSAVMGSAPSLYEAVSWLARGSSRSGIRDWEGGFDEGRARWAEALLGAALDSGWHDRGAMAIDEELGAYHDWLEGRES